MVLELILLQEAGDHGCDAVVLFSGERKAWHQQREEGEEIEERVKEWDGE